jgi:2Fe-2S ferredoxin
MAQVIFKHNGEDKVVELQPGDRLLKGAYTLELDSFGFGDCGGNCICSTCHVYVLEGADSFKPATSDEELTLDGAFDVRPNSRLACQLVVTPEHDQIVVEVPGDIQ